MGAVKQCRECKHDGNWQTYDEGVCAGCRDWNLFEPAPGRVRPPVIEKETFPRLEDPEELGKMIGNAFAEAKLKTEGLTPIGGSALDVQVGGSHYKDAGIQPIEYIFANKLGFCEGNVVKYVTRYGSKNGVQDLKKARHYLDMLIEKLEKTA